MQCHTCSVTTHFSLPRTHPRTQNCTVYNDYNELTDNKKAGRSMQSCWLRSTQATAIFLRHIDMSHQQIQDVRDFSILR